MPLVITLKENEKVIVGETEVIVNKIRKSKIELAFVGDHKIPIISPRLQKKLENEKREYKCKQS